MTKPRRHRALRPGLGCSTASAPGTDPGGLTESGRATSVGPERRTESGSPVSCSPLEEAPTPADLQAESAAENRNRRRSCSKCGNGSAEGAEPPPVRARARVCPRASQQIIKMIKKLIYFRSFDDGLMRLMKVHQTVPGWFRPGSEDHDPLNTRVRHRRSLLERLHPRTSMQRWKMWQKKLLVRVLLRESVRKNLSFQNL